MKYGFLYSEVDVKQLKSDKVYYGVSRIEYMFRPNAYIGFMGTHYKHNKFGNGVISIDYLFKTFDDDFYIDGHNHGLLAISKFFHQQFFHFQ